jgi:succinyl-CoA synthetase alpha subunit
MEENSRNGLTLKESLIKAIKETTKGVQRLSLRKGKKSKDAAGISRDNIVAGKRVAGKRVSFQDDPDTKAIVMIGEIGGDAEERAAAFISEYVTKPVVGYVAGFTAPEGKTMGHAGAIVSGSSGTAQAKKDALEAAGVKVGKTPSESAQLMRAILGR